MAEWIPPRLLWHTVRHLRRTQWLGQLRLRVAGLPRIPAALADPQPPQFPGCRWPAGRDWPAPGSRQPDSSDLQRGTMSFLNESRELGWPPSWEPDEASLLWRYNLHYFEWLWSLPYESARQAVSSWIEGHPLGRGRVGWQPYPTSLRLLCWLGFFFGRHRTRTDADPAFREALWTSVWTQAEWLGRNLETHLLGNHLLENGAALALSGSCFDGPAGQAWLEQGLSILDREIPEQILPDGMHFERSPMYHLRVTYLVLLLLGTGQDTFESRLRSVAERMLAVVERMRHPDGEIALFNDSAFGIYSEPGQLLELGRARSIALESPEEGPWALPDAGYYGFRGADGASIVCDAGPIGPDYLPGHAHGDIFSFELSMHGRRVIVDSGVHDYDSGRLRRYCRSTAAHNTVSVEQQDQCEFWGGFRVGRRGRPHDVRWQPTERGFRLDGWHDGYFRLRGAPRHAREFHWHDSGILEIFDEVHASREVESTSRLHFHPACRFREVSERCTDVSYPGGTLRVGFYGSGKLRQEPSRYCPEFGVEESNVALAFTFHGRETKSRIRIEPV